MIEIAFILDRSGSMQALRADAIRGFNTFLAEQRELAAGEARLSLVLFSDEHEWVHDGLSLEQVPELNATSYQPGGSTALLDAVGFTLGRLAARESLQPVLVAILTDGFENSSRHFTFHQVLDETRRWQREGWGFLYLAADPDAIASAARLGVARRSVTGFSRSSEGMTEAYRTLSSSASDLRLSGQLGPTPRNRLDEGDHRLGH